MGIWQLGLLLAKQMTKKIPPVSHSHLQAFEQCPRKYEHYYVLKDVPWERSPEMDKGKAVHEQQEQRIKSGWLSEGGYDVKAEVKLGITTSGAVCDFFSEFVYCRGTLDCVATHKDYPQFAVLFDWKTGKKREDPTELQIHGLLLKCNYPRLSLIKGHYVWMADGTIGPPHDLSDTGRTFELINEQVDNIAHQMKMGYMPPKQSPLCAWCRVESCEYNPRRQGKGRN
jgi:hypothetical protein